MREEGVSIPLFANKCGKVSAVEDNRLPYLAYLELTPLCNNNCVGCPNAVFASGLNPRRIRPEYKCNYLDGSQWKSVIAKFPPSISAVILTGGEATLHPDFSEILFYLEESKLDFVIFTNGRWKNPHKLISFLKKLRRFRGFLLSIHGASSLTHEDFTGITGSFDDTIKNVRLAIENDLHVTISTVITKANCNEIKEIFNLGVDLGASEVSFNRYLTPYLPDTSVISFDLSPSSLELKNAILTIEELKSNNSNILPVSYGPCIPKCFAESSSVGCSAGETFFVIDPLGNIKPCTDANLICGNIFEESIEEIWTGKKMEQWRSLSNPTCNNCSVLSICKTGCKAMAINSGLQRDPLMVLPNQIIPISTINP